MIAEVPPPPASPSTPAPAPVPAAAAPRFVPALRRFHRRWMLGLFLAGVLSAVWWTGLALFLLGVLDYYAGFSDPARRVVGSVLLTVAAAGLIMALWRAMGFLRRQAAVAADRALDSGRREVLSAFELQSATTARGTPLAGWLSQRAVHRAAEQVKSLRLSRSMPVPEMKRALQWCLGLAAVFGLCALLLPAATQTIARRLLTPGADVPPYSALRFTVGPQPAEVLYGGEILIAAEIDGGEIDAPVRFFSRDPVTGRIEDSAAFQEKAGRFSAKLEKVAAPVEVAFAVGRARSAWLPVTVRLQPKIQDVVLTVEPPAYSGLPRREFAAGSQDLSALPGSRVTARVASNRPLGGGTLRIGTASGAPEVKAEIEDTHRVRFTWTARNADRLAMEVRDVLGTASESLQIEQKLIPDARPDAVLRQPSGDVLATPDGELPIEAAVSDDLGLTRVALVRQLHGYRERAEPQAVQPGNRRHELTGNLALKPFGLVPGQVIELSVEAGDTNPNLLGVGVSEPARIHIIEREKYAEMLRAQTTMEDFAERYEALKEAMDAAREALLALDKAVQSGDAAKAEEARAKALEAHQKAAKLFGAIAKDFPIFDLDEKLAATSLEAMKQLFENARELEGLAGQSPSEMGSATQGLKDRLGAVEKEMNEPMKQGERAVAAGKVFEQVARFKEVIEEQRELVKDYNRILEQIRRGEAQAGHGVRDLGKQQQEIAEKLRGVERNLAPLFDALPEEYEVMAKQGREFLEMLRGAEIPPVMDEGSKAAENADGRTAGDRAGEALARLEALLRKKNGICGMCRGDKEPFPWPEDLAKMLQQLMQALIQKPGKGGGDGQEPGDSGSTGFGGTSESGFSMKGKMPRLPIFGPSRQRFSKQAGPHVGGDKPGKGTGNGAGRPEIDSTPMASKATEANNADAAVAEVVPEAYRDAVKRYFSTDTPAAPGK